MLGRVFKIPRLLRRSQQPKCIPKTPQASFYNIVDVFGARSHMRAEILLFLGAVAQSVPISRLSGVLASARQSTTVAINALEAFGVVRSIRRGPERLIALEDRWVAHAELLCLIRRLNALDTTYADLAAAYRTSRGTVGYIK